MTCMYQEILESPSVLRRIEEENRATLEALCAVLRERGIRHVTFVGRGTSDHAAIYGQYLMSIVGHVNAGLAVPSCISLYGAKTDYRDSLVVALSQSGRAADAMEVIRRANECGGVTVAITNYKDSPLAEEAAFSLWCAAGEERSVAATKTFTAQLALLYLLTAYWFDKPAMRRRFATLPTMLETLCAQNDTDDLLRPYRYIEDGFVLSRGITYPIALETMLKVQETCYVKLKAYSAADVYHGPLAQLDANTPVIVYALDGAACEDNLRIVDRVREIGIEPLVVTDEEQVATRSALCYRIPKADDPLAAPIVLAAFAQLFAERLCALKGGDPDHPRNLKKVTITK